MRFAPSSHLAAMALKAIGVAAVFIALLFVFVIARHAPLWILQVGMFCALSGALAWPPKTFRSVSVWVMWACVAVSLVLSIARRL